MSYSYRFDIHLLSQLRRMVWWIAHGLFARVLLVLQHESPIRRDWPQYLQAVPDFRQRNLGLEEQCTSRLVGIECKCTLRPGMSLGTTPRHGHLAHFNGTFVIF